MRNTKLEKWEIAVLALAATLFFVSLDAYIHDFPLGSYLFGADIEEGQQRIGTVGEMSGSLKRELLGQSDFKSASSNDPLFMSDTVVTGSESQATLRLSDGSAIRLGPETMVKLQQEQSFDLLGVTRTTHIALVTGQIVGYAAKSPKSRVAIETPSGEVELGQSSLSKPIRVSNLHPVVHPHLVSATTSNEPGLMKSLFNRIIGSQPTPPVSIASSARLDVRPASSPSPSPRPSASPSPSPSLSPSPSPSPQPSPSPSPSPSPQPSPSPAKTKAVLELLQPKNGVLLKVRRGALAAQVPVSIAWKIHGSYASPTRLHVQVFRVSGGKREDQPIYQESVMAPDGRHASQVWVATRPGKFEVEVQLVGEGQAAVRARFSVQPEFEGIELLRPMPIDDGRKAFRESKVLLAWKPFSGAGKYIVRIYDHGDAIRDDAVSSNEYTVVRKSESESQLWYDVTAKLPTGFVAHSARDTFVFDFVSPDLSLPADKTVIGLPELSSSNGTVLMTWTKTRIGQGYIVEIANAPDFKKVLVTSKQRDNFLFFRPWRRSAKYWWRVSAYAGKVVSAPSAPFEFSVGSP